ncbi:MAG: FAD-dependent oxidoreductase [Planctomycetota bacterium]
MKVALSQGIYIPHLCFHPDLPPSSKNMASDLVYRGKDGIQHQGANKESLYPASAERDRYNGCKLCLVEVSGLPELQKACETVVEEGMVIRTETERIKEARQKNLSKILADHPHACLTCAQNEGCSLTQCSSNVPVNERCCIKFGRCEIQKVSEYIGIWPETPRYIHRDMPILNCEPLFTRNYNLCIGCTRCVRVCQEVRGIDALGFVYRTDNGGDVAAEFTSDSQREINSRATESFNDAKIVVGSRAETLAGSGCKFCGACVEVCPTGTLLDKVKITDRTKDLVPCISACPAGINVPGYVRSVKNGHSSESLTIIREKVPFPTVLGRVCFHPCEDKCRRNELNEPIAICALKRFASESETQVPDARLKVKGSSIQNSSFIIHNSKKVAIVGAGPAGLTAAFYLARLGYPVTVFESKPKPGGMMRYGIPAYRLPEEDLKKDIDFIVKQGVVVKTNLTLGKDFTIDSLKKEGFKVIFVAIGAQLPKKINIEGVNHKNVFWGIDFLRNIREGKKNDFIGKKVVVIGGGNVAIDTALSARRLGAAEIQITCLELEDEMPAHQWEIQQAQEEGISFDCCWGPKKIIPAGDKLSLEFSRCLCVFDETGKFNPKFDNNASNSVVTDMVIMAIGQVPERECLNGLELKISEISLMTEMDGIFAGGEVVHNPSSVIDAIADGRKAAGGIDKYLGGKGEIDEPVILEKPPVFFGRAEGFADWSLVKMPCVSVQERGAGFNEIEKGYDEPMALTEASRCLQCDVRLLISQVVLPPEQHHEFKQDEVRKIPETEGVFKLLDEQKVVIQIKGVLNLQEGLLEQLNKNKTACYFEYEEDKMYTKRESELLQQFLQKHGRLPGGGADELDELF